MHQRGNESTVAEGFIFHPLSYFMKTLGIYEGNLCTLIEGARIIILTKIYSGDMKDLIEYGELPIFNTYEEVETAAFGI